MLLGAQFLCRSIDSSTLSSSYIVLVLCVKIHVICKYMINTYFVNLGLEKALSPTHSLRGDVTDSCYLLEPLYLQSTVSGVFEDEHKLLCIKYYYITPNTLSHATNTSRDNNMCNLGDAFHTP